MVQNGPKVRELRDPSPLSRAAWRRRDAMIIAHRELLIAIDRNRHRMHSSPRVKVIQLGAAPASEEHSYRTA
jgi:hypothetical protein